MRRIVALDSARSNRARDAAECLVRGAAEHARSTACTWSRLHSLLLLLAVVGCSSIVPPRTIVMAPIEPDATPQIYLTTVGGERASVLAALEQTGFSVVSSPRDAPFVLTVKLGRVRSTGSCGEMRNVIYELSQAGVRLAVIKGRGWVGNCTPNILLDMSEELAHLFNR